MDEANELLGRAILTHFKSLEGARKEQQLSELFEIMALELSDAEIDRFIELTGYRAGWWVTAPATATAKVEPADPELADDIPF